LLAISLAAPGARAQAATPQYLFVGQVVPGPSGNVSAIGTYTVDAMTGALAPIAAAPVQIRGQGTGSLAINRAGTQLYGTTTNSAGLSAVEVFNVASDGSLTEVPNSPFGVGPSGAMLQLIAVSPNGNFLYLAYELPGTPASTIVDVVAIAANGSLILNNEFTYSGVETCDGTTPAMLTPAQFFVHPTQKYLYLLMASSFGPPCSGQASEVEVFTINSDGTLTAGPLDVLPLYATSAHALTGSPDGSILFITTNLNPGGEFLYSGAIDPTSGVAAFGPESGASITNGDTILTGLAVDSSSTYLYSGAGTFFMQDGAVTAIASSTNPFVNAGPILASPADPLIFGPIDAPQSGTSFFAGRVNSDGSLAPVTGSPYAIPASGAGAMVLSQPMPIPDTAVMWIIPDGPIDISGVPSGQTGSSNSISIKNVGYGPLTITSISATGDPSLSATNTCTSPLAPGGSCSAMVNFAPTSVNTFTGTLTIETNLAPRTFAISATSVNPVSNPVAVPSPLLFPDTAQGSSNSLAVQFQNAANASASLVVSGVTFAGSNPGDFSQTNNCSSGIAAGSFCTINVTFTPQALGDRAAFLNIATNASGGGLVQVSVSGNSVTTVTKFSFATVINGPGTITQTPTGTSLANNTTVTVKAVPNANSSFVNWDGICADNPVVPTCTLILNANTTATANFSGPQFSLSTSVVGPGTIQQTPSGTNFDSGTSITLTAVPGANAQFSSWSGACAGSTNPVCTFAISANTSVTATFVNTFTLATTVSGPGTIQQMPAGTSFASNTSITLTAVPGANASFTSWSGACAGSTNTVCTFALTANTTVTATFTANPTVTVPQTPPPAPAGSTFTAQINVTGFAMPPMLKTSCSIPQGSCSISGTTLTVTTTARTAGFTPGNFPHVPNLPGTPPELLLIALAAGGLAWLSRNSRARRFLRPAAFCVALSLAGCTGGGGTQPTVNGTPAGNYTVTITATQAAQTATTNLIITVQ
jgi:hypothetical protein